MRPAGLEGAPDGGVDYPLASLIGGREPVSGLGAAGRRLSMRAAATPIA